jgi:hypothetical protein
VWQRHELGTMPARLKAIEGPNAIATGTLGINDRGQIVGVFADAGVALHGFVAPGKK